MNRTRWLCLMLAALVFLGPLTHAGWSEHAVSPEPPLSDEDAETLAVAGGFLTVPGKFATCVGSIALWVVTMAVTLGTQYGDAAKLVIGGCGGKVATGEDIRKAVTPEH